MSFLTVPNLNDDINRLVLIIKNSTLLFPQTAGGDETKTDLVNQVIPYKLPIAEQPIEGPGPPHIFIKESPSSEYSQYRQVGRSTIDIQGPEEVTLEIYCVIVAHDPTSLAATYKQMFDIIAALKTTLKRNMRLADPTTTPPLQNPLATYIETITTPYLLDTEDVNVIAKNVIVRIKRFINLRS